jgi:hypothetical protein
MAEKTKDFSRNFDRPDERREFRGHGHLDVLNFEDGTTVGRGVFEPGWRWSTDVKPIAGTDSCQASHIGYCLSGSMVVRMDGGEEFRIRPGEVFRIPPGHDAWVEGDQRCELVDMGGFREYAKPARPEQAAGAKPFAAKSQGEKKSA